MNRTEHRGAELATKSKFIISSNAWPIVNFSSVNFDHVSYSVPGYTSRAGLRSAGQRYTLMERNEEKKCEFHAILWQDYNWEESEYPPPTGMSPWLSVALTTAADQYGYYHHRPDDDVRNRCYVWIVGAGGKKECMCRIPGGVHSDSDASEYTFCKQEFVLYDDLMDGDKGLLKDNQLTIVFEMRALTNEFSIVDNWLFCPLEPEVTQDSEHTLTKDHKRMLDSGRGSDVSLVANDGGEFPAHVSILASRSPVFAAMFEIDMIEKRERRVNIDDLDSQDVRAFLNFIYTDTVPDASLLEDGQLFYAAHKYNIPRLKMCCEEAMVAGLKTENAAERLSIGHMYDAAKLRRAAMHFTVRHLQHVKKTQGWKDVQNQSPHLIMEIVDELADVLPQLMSSE